MNSRFLRYKRQLKRIKQIRKLSGRSRFTMALHKSVFVLVALAVLSFLLFRERPWLGSFLFTLAGGCAAIAFCIEASATVRYAAATLWKHPLGKLTYAAIAYAGALISTAVSKHVAHELTGVNPGTFVEFVALMSGLSTVFFILMVAQAVIALLAVLFFLQGWILMLLHMVAGIVSSRGGTFVPLMLRILGGRKERHPRLVLGLYPTSMFIGAGVVLALLSTPFSAIARSSSSVENFFGQAMVLLEYRRNSACEDVPPNLPVAYVNKDTISVAVWNNHSSKYLFELRKCILDDKSGNPPHPTAESG